MTTNPGCTRRGETIRVHPWRNAQATPRSDEDSLASFRVIRGLFSQESFHVQRHATNNEDGFANGWLK